jgi:uncharacterized protein YjbI with pentapeptide repeats
VIMIGRFENCDFSYANLAGSDWTNATCVNCNFKGAYLDDGQLERIQKSTQRDTQHNTQQSTKKRTEQRTEQRTKKNTQQSTQKWNPQPATRGLVSDIFNIQRPVSNIPITAWAQAEKNEYEQLNDPIKQTENINNLIQLLTNILIDLGPPTLFSPPAHLSMQNLCSKLILNKAQNQPASLSRNDLSMHFPTIIAFATQYPKYSRCCFNILYKFFPLDHCNNYGIKSPLEMYLIHKTLKYDDIARIEATTPFNTSSDLKKINHEEAWKIVYLALTSGRRSIRLLIQAIIVLNIQENFPVLFAALRIIIISAQQGKLCVDLLYGNMVLNLKYYSLPDLTQKDISYANLIHANAQGVTWTDVKVVDASMCYFNFINSTIVNCHFRSSRIPYAYIANSKFVNCYFNQSDLHESEIINVQFINCNLTGVNFSGTTMKNVSFLGCKLRGASTRLFSISNNQSDYLGDSSAQVKNYFKFNPDIQSVDMDELNSAMMAAVCHAYVEMSESAEKTQMMSFIGYFNQHMEDDLFHDIVDEFGTSVQPLAPQVEYILSTLLSLQSRSYQIESEDEEDSEDNSNTQNTYPSSSSASTSGLFGASKANQTENSQRSGGIKRALEEDSVNDDGSRHEDAKNESGDGMDVDVATPKNPHQKRQ